MNRMIAIAMLAACSSSRAPAPAADRICTDARLDSPFVLRMMLSPGSVARDAWHHAYDLALLEQRQCALLTAPVMFDCHDDGCRAAELASGQLVLR